MFEKLSKVVTKHNSKIITIWALFSIFCLTLAPKAFDVLSPELGVSEDVESQKGQTVLDENFPELPDQSLIIVVDCKEGSKVTDFEVTNFINSTSYTLISMAPDVKEVKSIFLFDPVLQQALWYDFVSPDNSTTIIVVGTDLEWGQEAQDLIGEIRDTCGENKPSNVGVYVTGFLAVGKDLVEQAPHDFSRIEIIGLPLIAILLYILFRRVRAIVAPFITIGVALIAGMAFLYAIGQLTTIFVIAINAMVALGLGIGFDYSVFMISRFKEERGKGMPYEDSVQIMVQEAGHTITMSGLTVIAGFSALIIPNLGIPRSLGYSVIGVVIFLIIANLTLLPALLVALSGFLKDLGIPKEKTIKEETERVAKKKPTNLDIKESRKGSRPIESSVSAKYWRKIGQISTTHSKTVIVIILLAAVPMLFILYDMQLDTDISDIAPEGSDSVEGSTVLTESFGENKQDQITVIIHTETVNGVWNQQFLSDLATLNAKILLEHSSIINETTCITNYMAPPYNDFSTIPPFLIPQLVDINNGNDTTLIKITLNVAPYGNEAVDWIPDLRETIDKQRREGVLTTSDIYVSGNTATFYDAKSELYNTFLLMLTFVMILIFIILFVMMRSATIPLRLLFTILLSQAFVFAIAVVTLKHQLLSPVTAIGDQTGIFWPMPIIAVVILLGLGIDYDLFVTSRIKENVWKGMETREAIIDALQTTGTVITGLAAIMIAAFGTLLVAKDINLVQLGFILAIGVFIDATLVRTLLVPSVMSITEKYNWWPSKPPTQ